MAKQTLYGVTERDKRILQQLVRDFNRLPRNFQAPRRNPSVRNTGIRLARTTSTGTYPTRADARNAWEIEFVEATYTEEPGVQPVTLEAIDASDMIVAHNIYNDPFVPDGTLLKVWEYDSRWWFEYEDPIQIAVLQGTLTEGGSVDVKVQLPGGGNVPGGAVTAYDKLGVMNGSSPHKAYIKWQREHAQYWIINKECDASVPSTSFTPLPEAGLMFQPRRENERRRAGTFAMGAA